MGKAERRARKRANQDLRDIADAQCAADLLDLLHRKHPEAGNWELIEALGGPDAAGLAAINADRALRRRPPLTPERIGR